MLQQRRQDTEQKSAGRVRETREDAPLERYLDDLQKPMATLGEAAQQEWRAEAQSHLQSMITAYEELGDTHEEAVRNALARFGQPKTIGFRMRWSALKQVARQNPESRVTNCILQCYAACFLPALVSFLSFILLFDYTDNHAAQLLARNITGAILLLGPFLTGWLLGQRLPWLRTEMRRVRAVHGSRGLTRLWFALTVVAIATTVEVALFWSLVRTLSESATSHIIATDLLPALGWLPITLGVAYWRGRRMTAETNSGDSATPV